LDERLIGLIVKQVKGLVQNLMFLSH